MLTDKPIDLISSNNLLKESMYLDLSSLSIPLNRYKKFEKNDLNRINNNDQTDNKEMYNNNHTVNIQTSHIKVPFNTLPPPPHKIVNYNNNNNRKSKNDRKDYKAKENNVRANSPRGYDSDESCASCSSSAGSPAEHKGVKYNCTRNNGICRLGDQTIIFGKYSQSTPNVYQSSVYHTQNNGNYVKNRYYINTRQKHASPRNGTDLMLRRAHGLVERFRSRSDSMRIDPSPIGLLTGSPWDTLNQAIWDVYSTKAQKESTYELKINLWRHIFLFIRKCLNSYGLFMVGSTMSGFGLDSSDVDMCLLTKPFTNDPRLDALHHLNTVRQLFVRYGVAVESELILAKVPILKFREKDSGCEVDLNCNNSVGIRNTHLLFSYSKLDWRVRPLVVMVKIWAQINNINDAKNMTVSSYSFALMVIHFLQCGVTPPVLPCLHGLVPDKFNSDSEHQTMDVQEEIPAIKDFRSDNTNCLGELLLGFLRYYACFDYNRCAVSVRAGCRLPVEECRFAKAPKNDPNQWKHLCIEEPFDFTNTARSVFDADKFKFIRDVVAQSYRELERTKMLGSILPVQLHHQR
ncbi:unnamed protein product [Brassicogethes aeneus]|uniref:Uncharacterized protein n=1 Tax=Brassicogethes aeneus TaxID=1431903 RepID=A0A9P0FGI5_BRAAE|nr:unnamed protein product [Brassicogethes aeneus]